nr:hypothetical protein [uncultured Pseudodesulfovibrio sp.]
MKIAITLDVEEEGLFSGQYPRSGAGVSNVFRLDMLEWLTRDFDIPLTLLVDYPVAVDAECATCLRRWKDELGAEIGAHLHPWNTPPYDDGDPLDSSSMSSEMVQVKLASLVRAIEDNVGVTPTSFRMGRWDFSDTVRDALRIAGFLVDASVVPLKRTPAGDRYFDSSADPYWLDNEQAMLEVPLTVVPIFPATVGPAKTMGITKYFSHVGAMGIQPVWHSLAVMRRAATLHQKRGGRVLTMFFHSSELLPGASPHFPTEGSVLAFVAKLRDFITWLRGQTPIEGRTLMGLYDDMREGR